MPSLSQTYQRHRCPPSGANDPEKWYILLGFKTRRIKGKELSYSSLSLVEGLNIVSGINCWCWTIRHLSWNGRHKGNSEAGHFAVMVFISQLICIQTGREHFKESQIFLYLCNHRSRYLYSNRNHHVFNPCNFDSSTPRSHQTSPLPHLPETYPFSSRSHVRSLRRHCQRPSRA